MKRLGVVVSVLVVALVGSLLVRVAIDESDPLVVVHWSNSHPMREGLLPEMAERFNDEDHETSSGQPIKIKVISCDSAVQAEDLVARVTGGAGEGGCQDEDGGSADDPTIVTPQSDDWLVDINHRADRVVVDVTDPKTIAEAYLGIVTYREMAECLRSTGEPVGYADIVALASDPAGWNTYDCANPTWGTEPLLAFTNPNTSTSGRNVLVTLYAMAAGDANGSVKAPADLTVEDIAQPDVVDSVQRFQQVVDHYMPGTIPLNTKIEQGTDEGHFFLMPEDNLVSLYKGNEKVRAADGTDELLDPVRGLVMMYPEEGSVLNSNPASVVDANWVSDEKAVAANDWIGYLRHEKQQRAFMSAGFRPAAGTELAVDEQQFEEWGLDAQQPTEVIDPGDLSPDVLEKIVGSWGAVKKPSIVTFVVDVSGSMAGEPLEQVKEGMLRVLDEMYRAGADSSQIGLVTFADVVKEQIPPANLDDVGATISDAINDMEANDATALYDAVELAVELTDAADGEDGATRAVVVLSDGAATAGDRCLHDIVDMDADEQDIQEYCGMFDDDGSPLDTPIDASGSEVSVDEVNGDALRLDLQHDDLQVFFLGFGEADINVGRILAKATDADYQGSTDEDLAAVIEALSGYF